MTETAAVAAGTPRRTAPLGMAVSAVTDVRKAVLPAIAGGYGLREQFSSIGFVAGIGREGARLMPCIADRPCKRFERIGVAGPAVDAGGEALGGKGARDRAARGVAGADDDDCGVGHRDSPLGEV